MLRTQIQLTEEQARMLKELSRAGDESMAALIRQAIDHFLTSARPNRTGQYRQALTVVGKYKTGPSDIAVEHDRYLEEAFRS